MTNLELFMECLAALVFLWAGFNKIAAVQCQSWTLESNRPRLPFDLPFGFLMLVGLFEIVAALALIVPFGPWPQSTVASVAAIMLAFLTTSAILFRMRRSQPVEIPIVMLNLALFVVVARLF